MICSYIVKSFLILNLLNTIECSIAPGFNSSKCPENFFDCGNDRCIGHFWRCDGEDDCGNWADEHFCLDLGMGAPPKKKRDCPTNYSHCNDTRDTCIPNKWFCDGTVDCDDGIDEKNCNKETVACFGFLCHNFECIPKRWKCDGIPDCNDASDELDCNQQPKSKQICDKEHGFYQCMTGECISHLKVCDNHKDCPQGDDEGTECRPSGCHTKKCSQLCFVGPHGPQCYCQQGYHLDHDNTTCVDIDECASNRQTGLCSQSCINSDGGYKCVCNNEYKLVNNTCIVKDEEPLLLYSNGEGIRGFWLRSHRFFPVYHSLGQTVGLDFLNSDERVFWVNSDKDNNGIYSVGLTSDDFKPIVTNGLKSPEDIAIDWIGDNLYVTDAGLNALVVCRIDGSMCVSHLFGKLHRPRAVEVDPPKGFVYWTEWGNSSGIYRAGMDGSEKTHLVKDFIWPNGLALDREANRIYWTEAKFGKIEFLDLETNTRKVVVADKVFHPFGLAVFEDWIYWSDWFTFSLDMNHKFTGHNSSTLIRQVNEEIKGIHVFHPLTQKMSYNPCWMHSCSHMCVLAPDRSYSCVCPEHLDLGRDNKTCKPKGNDTFIMIAVGNEVKLLYPEAIGGDITLDAHLPQSLIIGDIAFNWNTKTLYIFDRKRLVIGSFELEEPTFDHLNIEHDHAWTPIITSQLESVEGLTYDSYTNQLYWLETREGILEVSTTDGKSRAVLLNNLDKPIDLALHPESRRMYVAVMGTDPHIMVSDMDGHNPKVLIASKTGFAVSLAIDRINNILYWADAKNGLIEYFKPSAPKGHPQRKGTVKDNLAHVMSIAVLNDTIFWTDIDSNDIYHQTLNKHKRQSKVEVNIIHKGKSVKKLLTATPDSVTNNPCKGNGGCSHLCLLGRFRPTCMCPFGYVLQSDGQKCQKSKDMSDNFVLCTDCVTSGEAFDLDFTSDQSKGDSNWFTKDEDLEADMLFARYDSKQRDESNEKMSNDSSTFSSSTTQTYVATNPSIKLTTKANEMTTRVSQIADNQPRRWSGRRNKTANKDSTSPIPQELGIKSENKDSEIVESIKDEAPDSHKKGWLSLFVAALIMAIIVLLIALIVRKDEYRSVLHQRADQLQNVIVRFRRPLTRNINRDEEEPLQSETKSLNEEKY